jgi:hypothetical protein
MSGHRICAARRTLQISGKQLHRAFGISNVVTLKIRDLEIARAAINADVIAFLVTDRLLNRWDEFDERLRRRRKQWPRRRRRRCTGP